MQRAGVNLNEVPTARPATSRRRSPNVETRDGRDARADLHEAGFALLDLLGHRLGSRAEVRGNVIWSPRQNANGVRNQFYENTRAVRPGDVVFSFCDTRIEAIGLVIGVAQSGPKPDFGSAGPNWSSEGWFVPVYYVALENQIRPKDHIDILRPFLPVTYSPLRSNGDGLQSVYLAEVPEGLADALISVIGQAYWDAWSLMRSVENAPGWVDDDELEADRVSIGPTIVKARRGQGVFRADVLLHETCWRVTLVEDPRHLKASHIKPWRDAIDNQRMDGSNGFLLSPHIDHLFEHGYPTFSPDQPLLVVPEVRDRLIDAWGIHTDVDVGPFTREQSAYLDYHRANVFNRHRSEFPRQ